MLPLKQELGGLRPANPSQQDFRALWAPVECNMLLRYRLCGLTLALLRVESQGWKESRCPLRVDARMPTIARIGPHRFFFYSNEGAEPPHVHVQHERNLAKFWLGPVALAASTKFKAHEVRQLEKLVTQNADVFLEAWHDYFGT